MSKLLVLQNVFLPFYFKFHSVLIMAENNILVHPFLNFYLEPMTIGLTAPPDPQMKN